MSTTRASTNMFIMKKKGLNKPIIFRDLVAYPAEIQPEVDDNLDFLRKPCGKNGGWFGYLSYDLGLKWMGMKSRHKCEIPLMKWVYCDRIIPRNVCVSIPPEVKNTGVRPIKKKNVIRNFKHSSSFEEYEKKIDQIKKYLFDGESYQVNFAQNFTGEAEEDFLNDLSIQTTLSIDPYVSFFMDCGDFSILSFSPERLFSLKNGKIRTEPIKGTISSRESTQKLIDDKKNQAELAMIVDLMRNDVGKVSKMGSVEVVDERALMKLPNVTHTYAVIESYLDGQYDIVDVIKALFPGGSVTGCPKKRTMEIIDELEDFSRGAYCGSAGYVLDNGDADFNILIRTATICDGRISFPCGGGILIDSDAKSEFEESIEKSKILNPFYDRSV